MFSLAPNHSLNLKVLSTIFDQWIVPWSIGNTLILGNVGPRVKPMGLSPILAILIWFKVMEDYSDGSWFNDISWTIVLARGIFFWHGIW